MNKRLALTILVDDEDILLLLKNKRKREDIYIEKEKNLLKLYTMIIFLPHQHIHLIILKEDGE